MSEALLCDPCFWIYLAIVVVSLYGFVLFIWWWHKVNQASEVYIYFTILLASEAFYNFFNAVARYYRLESNDMTTYLQLVHSPIWEFRAIFHLIILSVIVGRMTLRAITTLRQVKRFKVEESDNVSTSDR